MRGFASPRSINFRGLCCSRSRSSGVDWAQREKRHKRAPRHRETIGPKSRSQCAIRVSVASSRDISLPRFADDEISEGGLASSGVTAACSGSSPRRALVRLCSVIATPIRMPAEIPRATVTSSSTAFENTTAAAATQGILRRAAPETVLWIFRCLARCPPRALSEPGGSSRVPFPGKSGSLFQEIR